MSARLASPDSRYIHQILAHNNSQVLRAWRADQRFSDHLHVIEELPGRPGAGPDESDEPTAGDSARYRPGLPPGGLVVVPCIGAQVDAPDAADAMTRRSGLDPAAFDDDPAALSSPVAADDPAALLAHCQQLAERTDATIALFHGLYQGDICKRARAWVFEGMLEIHYRPDGAGVEVSASVAGISPARRHIVDGDVLTLTLLHFDLLSLPGCFEPHRASFPWDRFRDPGAV